jgi:transcriptional regulator with XRE-family HTH domain
MPRLGRAVRAANFQSSKPKTPTDRQVYVLLQLSFSDRVCMAVLAGATLRVWRERAGLTRKALARRMGSQEATIARWEKGRGLPALATLIVVAELCGADVHEVVDALLASRKRSARALKTDLTESAILSARAGAFPISEVA